MPYCSVKWCGKCSATSSLTKDGITFHRFPQCSKMKEKWINATKRDDNWFPAKNHVICSRHFTEDCFRPMSGNRRLLFETAVPTQMLPCLQSSHNSTEASTLSAPETTGQKIFTLTTQPTFIVNATNIPLAESIKNILVVPSTPAKSETVNSTQQNTSVDSLINTPSTCSTPKIRQLHRAIIDLSEKLKKKNRALKRLRDSNRWLKRKVHSLKQLLGERKNEKNG